MSLPKFASSSQSFHAELKRRISAYFEEVGTSQTGNRSLFIKAVILMISFVFIYIHLVFFTPAWYHGLLECAFLGIVISGVGFNVMHDGGHGSYSTKKAVANQKQVNRNASVW